MKFSSLLLSTLICSTACLAVGPEADDGTTPINPIIQRSTSERGLKDRPKEPTTVSRRRSLSTTELPLGTDSKDIIIRDDSTSLRSSDDEAVARSFSEDMLPTHKELIDLTLPWGLNLSRVVQRADLVRANQKLYGHVNDEVATFLMNLGTQRQRAPLIYQLDQNLQRKIIEIYEEKRSLDEERYALKQATNGVITPDVQELMDKIAKLDSQIITDLSAADIEPDQFDRVIRLAQPIYKEKERALEILGPLGLTATHLAKLPPRSDFEKKIIIRESARKPRRSLKEISSDDITEGLDDIHARYYEIEKEFPGATSEDRHKASSEDS